MAIEPKCAECGVLLNHEDSFRMDVYAPQNEDLYAVFCGQPHAAHWLTRPLPQAMPAEPLGFGGSVFFLVMMVLLGLSVVGVMALVQGIDVNPF